MHVRDTCLCLHAQRTARFLARYFDDAFRSLGITNQQFSLLMSLNRPTPTTFGPVAALLAIDQTTLTAALKVLERRSLVAISMNSEDRRSKLLALTNAGRELISMAMPIWKNGHQAIEERLDLDADALRQAMRALS